MDAVGERLQEVSEYEVLDVCNKPVFKVVFWLALKPWAGAHIFHLIEERRQGTLKKASMAHKEHGEGHSPIEDSPTGIKECLGHASFRASKSGLKGVCGYQRGLPPDFDVNDGDDGDYLSATFVRK